MTTKITEKNISSLANIGVNWQAVVVADGSTGLTAVAGRGYFIDTTSGTQTVTLPTSANVGDVIVLKDYARTWATNNVTIASTLFDGSTNAATFSTSGQTVTLVRMDNTKGWSLVNEDTTTGLGAEFISATGGTVTTSGDFKIHTFTGDGSFVVSSLGNPLIPAAARDTVDYIVVAGGGGGGGRHGGGGGAGGFREAKDSTLSSPHTASPLAATTGITITATTFPITVGAGGTGGNRNPSFAGANGSPSVFSTITSTGGGRGYTYQSSLAQSGGSGGGAGHPTCGGPGGSGNTPPTNPSQGNSGGAGTSPPAANDFQGGGGGGATASGGVGPQIGGGDGGAGATTSISGSPTAYAGGGGGGKYNSAPGGPGAGGTGGGGNGGGGPPSVPTVAIAGTANTGGGGGGYGGTNCAGNPDPRCQGAAGGLGIVVIRYKFQ